MIITETVSWQGMITSNVTDLEVLWRNRIWTLVSLSALWYADVMQSALSVHDVASVVGGQVHTGALRADIKKCCNICRIAVEFQR